MLGSLLRFTGRFAVAVLMDTDDVDQKSKQLKQLDDGTGQILIGDQHYTLEEAKVMQARGELYNIHN